MKKDTYVKKGQVGTAIGSVITLIVGIGIAVLVLIFVGSLGGQTYNLMESDLDAIGNHPITGESFTPINGTEASFAHSFIQQGTLAIANGSQSVGLGNFTLDYDAGTYLLTNNAYNNTALTANYTWGAIEAQNSVKAAIVSGFGALDTTGGYVPIIVLAVVIALVLGMVLGIGSIGTRGSGGSAL